MVVAMANRILAISSLLCVLALPRPASAGPWISGRWHFYLQLRQSALFADQRYDAAGNLQPIRVAVDGSGATQTTSYRQALTDLFAELGLGARLALLIDFHGLSAIDQPLSSGARRAVGVSDLWLGLKLLLFDDELAAALQVGITVPTGSPNGSVPLGPGDFREDFTLLVGKLFRHPHLFLSGEAGVRLRGSAVIPNPIALGTREHVQYSHELRYAGAFGYTLMTDRKAADWFSFAIKLEGAYALSAPVEDGLGVLDPVAGSYLKLGPEVTWAPTKHVQVSLGGHYFVAGRAMVAFGEVALGLAVSR